MNLKELSDRLSEKFRGGTVIDIQDIEKWADTKHCVDYQGLYDQIILKYPNRVFPPLSFIEDCYNELYPDEMRPKYGFKILEKIQNSREQWKKLDVQLIVDKVKTIREKTNEVGFTQIPLIDKEFFCLYQDIAAEHSIMVEARVEADRIKNHLEYVKAMLESNQRYEDANTRFFQERKPEVMSVDDHRIGRVVPASEVFGGNENKKEKGKCLRKNGESSTCTVTTKSLKAKK